MPQDTVMTDIDDKNILNTGYDLPVYGIKNGAFYPLHILALCLILISLCSVATTLILTIRRGWRKNFFKKWTKSERFVVYLAVCDGIFNIVHTADHTQLLITKQHVYPRGLCTLYAFVLVLFAHGQVLMVNMIAVNVFMHLYFGRPLHFGKWDWKLLTWSLGIPFILSVICTATGQFGTTGFFCFVDPIAGRIVYSSFCILFVPVIMANSVLYLLTWWKIRSQVKEINSTLQGMAQSSRASRSTAKTLTMFIVAFTVQWTAPTVFSMWSLFDEPPLSLHYSLVCTANLGGFLNLIVYLMVCRNKAKHKELRNISSNIAMNKIKGSSACSTPELSRSRAISMNSPLVSQEKLSSSVDRN